MLPTIKADSAAISTAAADKSLINFIWGLYSFENSSARRSIDVLKISAAHTKPIAKTSRMISVVLQGTIKIRQPTIQVAKRCIHAFCSSSKKEAIPLKANLKLLKLFNTENFFCSDVVYIGLILFLFTCFFCYPFPPKSSTGSIYKYLIEAIWYWVSISDCGYTNWNHKQDSQQCNKITYRIDWQIKPTVLFKPCCFHY